MLRERYEIARVLDDEAVYQMVRADLAQRYPKTQQTGRGSTPVEVILRMLVVKHLYKPGAATFLPGVL